jgi:hypothetical protein
VFWGVNMAEDPLWYREYSPLSMLSPILGHFRHSVTARLGMMRGSTLKRIMICFFKLYKNTIRH